MVKMEIDGYDILSRFGIMITQGGLKDLMTLPALKNITEYDWPEEDGAEYDFDNMRYAPRELSITMAALQGREPYEDFLEMLRQKTYHDCAFYNDPLGDISHYTLRLIKVDVTAELSRLITFTAVFAHDDPTEMQVDATDWERELTQDAGVEINGMDLAEVNCRVTQGTIKSLLRSLEAKDGFKVDIASQDGVEYDAAPQHFKPQEAKINLMMATSTARNLRMSLAMLLEILSDAPLTLSFNGLGVQFTFFYKSCQAMAFHCTGNKGYWLEMILTIQLLSSQSDTILIAENGAYLTTNDNKYIAI